MRWPSLLRGRLLRRYKRFLADVELDSGETVVAHCPNPGSMKSMKEDGSRVWLSESDNPKRKLAFTWELVQSSGALTLVNTQRANPLVREAFDGGLVKEVAPGSIIRSEVAYGEGSRVDFLIEPDDAPAIYVEVKNVTMADGVGRAAFPDSVTKRGAKHMEELGRMVDAGHRAAVLFCCSRAGVERIRAAEEIDPGYAEALSASRAKGVEVWSYGCRVTEDEIAIDRPIECALR